MTRNRANQDYSWVSRISDASQITDSDRLLAAGLQDFDQCAYAFSLDSDVVPLKDKGCTKKKCEGNPGCLNYLGIDKLLDDKGKEKFVAERMVKLSTRGNEPAGLRNLGATCYLWFYNAAFRNAIYASSPVEGSPLFHLAYIFASLQYTQRTYVDPTVLIEALRLDKGDQQDAGEFCKLFLDLISAELSKQNDPRLKMVTKDLFEGVKEVAIICDECGYQSSRQEPFLELEIPLKDGETLADRLRFTLSDESMRESNKYNCPQCRMKQNATRRTTLRQVPPILNFTLVRFAYDYRTGEKKKSKAAIKFPLKLKVDDQDYHLQAVVSHFGTDNHGHFVCEALDDEAEQWWLCDDEVVSKINRKARPENNGNEYTGPPTKRLKANSHDQLTSRNAYMLVYSRGKTPNSIEPNEEVMRKIREDDEKWMQELGDQERRKYILEEEYDTMTPAKKQVAALLQGFDRLLPTTELERWFAASSLSSMFGPWTIPTCIHGAIDPENPQEFKLVSQAAFDVLQDYCTRGPEDDGINTGGIEEFHDGNGLAVENGVGLVNGKGKRKEISQHSSPSSDPTSTTTYPLLPGLPICVRCVAEIYSEKAVPELVLTQTEKQIWQAEVKRDKALFKNDLDKVPQVYGVDYYYLPMSFVESWRDYVSKPMMPKPALEASLGRCEHGSLDVDLQMDETHYITAQGWVALMNLYDPTDPITFQFRVVPEPEKRYNKIKPSVGLCTACRTKRLSDFTETEIIIELHRTVSAKGDLPKITSGRTSRRGKPKEMRMDVTKSTKLLDIKVMVYNESGILPTHLGLYHNGREVDKDETIESASVLAGDTIVCKEINEIDMREESMEVEEERGFGGTLLTGRRKCPDCTFENDRGAHECAVCLRLFGWD